MSTRKPSTSPDDRRDRHLGVWLTARELQAFDIVADAYRVTRSALARRVISDFV
jgi:hypothetical protein